MPPVRRRLNGITPEGRAWLDRVLAGFSRQTPAAALLFADFDESKHHRGQPKNKGQFGPGGGGGSSAGSGGGERPGPQIDVRGAAMAKLMELEFGVREQKGGESTSEEFVPKGTVGGVSADELRMTLARAQEAQRQLAGRLGRGWNITEANAHTAVGLLSRGEDPSGLWARVPESDREEMRHVAAELGAAEVAYHERIRRIGLAKEPWQMTKDDAEHAVTYGNMARAVQVGDERTFYRVGAPPASGRSFNTMTNRQEDGVSVYVTPSVGSLAGEVERPWYYGKGKVIGFGGDDEPVVEITGEWSKYPGHKAVVKKALAAGKPVPPEVLADYPDFVKKYQKPGPPV